MIAGQNVTWADAFTAFGTVGAVVMAMLIAGWPWVVRQFRGPKLELVVGRAEPFLRPIPKEREFGFDELRLRVGIQNSGRRTAEDIVAIFQNWWEFNGDKSAWEELDADPLPMKWIAIRPSDDRPGEPPTVSILPGCTEYLDIVIWRSTEIELLVDDRRQTLFRRRRSPALGTWRVQFALAGTNCQVKMHTIEFECDGKNYISRVEVSSPPEDSQHVGLFHLLDGLVAQQEAPGDSRPTES